MVMRIDARLPLPTSALQAYRVKAKECHPDIAIAQGIDPTEAAEIFVIGAGAIRLQVAALCVCVFGRSELQQ